MKLTNVTQVHEFLSKVNECKGEVYLTSSEGDKFNLKSALTQYVAMGALLGNHGDELELLCEDKDDEKYFVEFFLDNPEVM